MKRPDGPARLLAAAVRVIPAERRDWGRAMQAELAAITDRSDRWAFSRGSVRAFRPLRGALHLLAVLGAASALFAWVATLDFPPLTWILYGVVSVLAAVCWEARRAGMLGPAGDGVTAWVLRGGGYLIAGVIAAFAVAHTHPATAADADRGAGGLAVLIIGASFLLGPATACAGRSAATARVLLTGAGSGLAATAVWLVLVLIAPPIPDTVGWALMLSGVAAVVAVLANAAPSSSAPGTLLAGLLALATAMALIFAAVVALAHWGPDSLIPNITPHALPGQRISESRVEIVDPYVLIIVLGAVAATALSFTAVHTRRSPVARGPS